MEFKFLLPAKVVMGPDLRERTGEYLRELGMAHVLIVTDAGVKAAGLLNGVYASLNEWEIAFDEISDVKANPRSEDINQAAQLYRGKGIQGLLAIGGGSAMDAAKAISLLLTHEGRIEDYEGSFTLRHAIPPIVAIPTTAGTGSEVTCFSVITDTARHFKMSVQDYRVGPVLALGRHRPPRSAPAPAFRHAAGSALPRRWPRWTGGTRRRAGRTARRRCPVASPGRFRRRAPSSVPAPPGGSWHAPDRGWRHASRRSSDRHGTGWCRLRGCLITNRQGGWTNSSKGKTQEQVIATLEY